MEKSYFERMQEINKEVEKQIIKIFNLNSIEELYFPIGVKFIIPYQKHFNIGTELLKSIILDDNKLIILTTDERLTTDMLLVGTLAELYPIILDEIRRRNIEIFKQRDKINSVCEKEYRVYCLDKQYRFDNDCEFLAKALKFGKVFTFEEFNSLNGLTNFNFKVLPYFNECVELCPYCDNEVVLETKFQWQTCPICNKEIKPCCLCSDCNTQCPLGTININL